MLQRKKKQSYRNSDVISSVPLRHIMIIIYYIGLNVIFLFIFTRTNPTDKPNEKKIK